MNSIENYVKVPYINQVLKEYFSKHPGEVIKAKEMMDEFVKVGLFKKNDNSGRPIIRVLKELEGDGRIDWIPYAFALQKTVHKIWYFRDISR